MWPRRRQRSVARTADGQHGTERAGAARRAATQHDTLPVTGAWQPGDPVGHRQFFRFPPGRPFALDGGIDARRGRRRVRDVGHARRQRVATRSCSATRGPATATPPATRVTGIRPRVGGTTLIGPGCALDTDRWFVVCANVLGGCQGSTGPASPHPADGQPVRQPLPGDHDPRHGARAGAARDHLGIERGTR